MILADKIIEERKKLGLSQEELADKLAVSRQAVSKWENAQSIPDLQKIVAMSQLFSVSTDYLLKDEMETAVVTECGADEDREVRRVNMEEANDFLSAMEQQGRTVALGVMLCIFSLVLIVFLAGLSQAKIAGITETTACAVGLAASLLLIAAAVYLFIQNASRTERFKYLEKEVFETAYGVSGLVKEKKAAFEPVYTRYLSLGIVLCLLSPLPLLVGAVIYERSELLAVSLAALLLCIVSLGVYMIVRVSTVKESFRILLQEGEYNKADKKNPVAGTVNTIYWGLALTVYLAWSFITMDWGYTWIVWPIAGVLCAPVIMAAKLIGDRNR